MFFGKKSNEKRSIEEILTPKEEKVEAEKEEIEMVEELDENIEEVETSKETKAENFTDNALKCFGWKEIKTEKWLVKCARVWYGIMSFIWFLFGALTFAPIAFVSNKVNAIVKDKKYSLLLGIAIYVCLICGIIILSVLRMSPS
jgi:hypothetical protein